MSDDSATATYTYKPRATGPAVTFRLLPTGRLIVDTGRRVDDVRLSAVSSVRLIHAPSNLARDGFKTFLRLADGRKVTLSNLSFTGIARIERHDAAYSAFVRALVAAVAQANRDTRFIRGRSMPVWLLTALVALGTVAGVLVFVLRGLQLGEIPVALFGIGALALAVWQVEPMVRLNRPGTFTPDAPPADLLPG